jgi:hypothetical protein
MRGLILFGCVNVVDIQDAGVCIPTMQALAAKGRNENKLPLPISRTAFFVSLTFAPVPVATPTLSVAEPSACRWRSLAARAFI